MNKNLFDFAEDKFLEKLPTTINEVKQSFEQVKNDTYQQNTSLFQPGRLEMGWMSSLRTL